MGFVRPGRPCISLKLSRNRGIGVEHTKRREVARRACTWTRLHEAWLLACISLGGSSPRQENSNNPERRGRASGDKASSRRCFDLLLFLTWLRGELIVARRSVSTSLACWLAGRQLIGYQARTREAGAFRRRIVGMPARMHAGTAVLACWLCGGLVVPYEHHADPRVVSMRDTDRAPV